jgi:hypothetical protein
MSENKQIAELLKLANQYPSLHNGQPIELVQVAPDTFDILFQKERGLQAAEVSFLFSYVTMGVFINHLSSAASALGHTIEIASNLPPIDSLRGKGEVKFATCIVKFHMSVPDESLHRTLLLRQTSRKKYTEGLDSQLSQATIAIASESNMELVKMSRSDTQQAIWLNQRAVFDDMFDDEVRMELDHWLRYNKAEKVAKQDGLAYDCMELNGPIMKFIVKHHKMLRMPGVSNMLKNYYLRTMSDNSDVFYLLTPFSTEQEAFDVGTAVMKIWLAVAAKGYYLHPFGTIMSNVAAHKDFLTLANIQDEDIHTNFLVFIYRAGMSESPHASLRIPVNEHLLRSKDV